MSMNYALQFDKDHKLRFSRFSFCWVLGLTRNKCYKLNYFKLRKKSDLY